jgi:hypothetical protein
MRILFHRPRVPSLLVLLSPPPPALWQQLWLPVGNLGTVTVLLEV